MKLEYLNKPQLRKLSSWQRLIYELKVFWLFMRGSIIICAVAFVWLEVTCDPHEIINGAEVNRCNFK